MVTVVEAGVPRVLDAPSVTVKSRLAAAPNRLMMLTVNVLLVCPAAKLTTWLLSAV